VESRRSRRKKNKPGRRRLWPFLATLSFFLLLAAGTAFAFLFFTVEIEEPQMSAASSIYDRNGELVGRLFVENRTPIALGDIPVHLRQAVVAIEDHRFYLHHGVNPVSIGRALVRNLQSGRVVEGGSTITQQLAKNLFLTPERTLTRKIKELVLTLKLEMRYSKNELLAKYLNVIYLGHGTYGVEAAAQSYFQKPASELTLAESAMLAGLIRSPENYSPYVNPERAEERKNLVLDRMLDYNMIDGETAAAAKSEKVPLPGLRRPALRAPYFVQYVIEQLSQHHPEVERFIYRGGYRIETTLDLQLQLAAEKAVSERLPEGKPDSEGVLQPQVGLVAIDPNSGEIRAMVGGRSFENSKFNRALARRQPGSAFKPFVYAAVLDSGYTAVSRQVCEPVSFPGANPNQPYQPTDYGDQPYHYRPMTIREALKVSDNVVAVRWLAEIGPAKGVRYAQLLGIESPLEASLPLVLGASEVTPLEMAAAYCPFANLGLQVQPYAIRRAYDNQGNLLEENRPQVNKVLDENTAYLITDLLKTVMQPGGTGGHLGLGRPVAGKTGTSEDQRDAWFIGYTPDIVVAVYVGHDQPANLRGYGGTLAGPIWLQTLQEGLAGIPARDFPQPAGIRRVAVCSETGHLPNQTCPTVLEPFRQGTEPRQVCTVRHATGEITLEESAAAAEGETLPEVPEEQSEPAA
jgi:1A family penicillin-binding protein